MNSITVRRRVRVIGILIATIGAALEQVERGTLQLSCSVIAEQIWRESALSARLVFSWQGVALRAW
jgi:hypothetical protein